VSEPFNSQFPSMRPFRQDPRFQAFVERLDLLEYLEVSRGCTDLTEAFTALAKRHIFEKRTSPANRPYPIKGKRYRYSIVVAGAAGRTLST